ncbi:MAG: chemotaxis protein CheW [Steroidobacteraceae bacterium]
MSTLHVICRVADAEYAIPADEVYQMESFSGATPVPGAPPYVAGLVQVRQKVLPLVDLRIRFGLPPGEPSDSSRIVVLQLGDRLVGMLVDSAREVREIAAEQFRPPPDVVARQSAGFVRSVTQLNGRIIMLLDAGRVVGEERSDG